METTIKSPRYDSFTPSSALSSVIKSRNKSKNTRAELILRHHVWRLGLRYRLHVKNLPGKPDLVFHSAKVVVFCDGDFWHGRNWLERRKRLKVGANADYWVKKIEYNRVRDRKNNLALKNQGWKVIRVWESSVLNHPKSIARKIAKVLDEERR